MKSVFRKTFLLFTAAFICLLCCSCTTVLTLNNMGRESFRWDPKDMQVSIRTTTDNNFTEHKTVYVEKKGSLKEYWLPYDFSRRYPSESKITRTLKYPAKGNLPVFAVKVDKNAKPVAVKLRNGQVTAKNTNLNYSFAGLPESVHPYKVTPGDFQLLRKPFWFYRGNNDWNLCVPLKTVDFGDYYHIAVAMIHPGGERYLPPDKIREEERYWNGIGINCARVLFSILPLAFDIATFPVQAVVLTLL